MQKHCSADNNTHVYTWYWLRSFLFYSASRLRVQNKKRRHKIWQKKMKLIGCFGKGCSWKRVLLEMAELENGCLEKHALGKGWIGKGCFWKRVLLEMDGLENGHLEKGALGKGWFGKGCSWKRVLLEMDELENGLLEKVLLEKNAFGKKERMGELKSSKKEKK